MAKAKSYKLQGREWTVKDLAEELGLSTHRVYRLLKEHNEDIKAIFESRGITPKAEEKGPKARLFDYKGKQWTVKQLAEEFGLSYVRVNRLIKEFDGDIEKIALTRSKSKKTAETKKAPKAEKTDEKTEIVVDDKEIKSLALDLEDKVSFEGIEIDQSITDLYIRYPLNLTDIRALASLNNLQKLSLSDCYELTDIRALASLKNLKELDLSDCKKLTDISALASLENLEKLNLRSNEKLRDISALASLNNLKELRLGGERLKDISALASLNNLKELDLSRCEWLTDISALASLKNLKELDLSDCKKLIDISALASLKNLEKLILSHCGLIGWKKLTDISALASLENLNELDLSSCHNLTDISALASLENLNKLDLSWCKKLTDISALASLENLEKLDLKWCEDLTDISALASLKNLEAPNLSDCPKIINRDILKSKKTEIISDDTDETDEIEKDEDQLWDEINDEPSAHYEKWEKLRENIYEIGDIEGSRYMEIADENEYNAFKQSYENHPDFGEEYTNFLNKYSEIFNNEDLDRENLAALFFNNNDLSDDFKDYILRQMAP